MYAGMYLWARNRYVDLWVSCLRPCPEPAWANRVQSIARDVDLDEGLSDTTCWWKIWAAVSRMMSELCAAGKRNRWVHGLV